MTFCLVANKFFQIVVGEVALFDFTFLILVASKTMTRFAEANNFRERNVKLRNRWELFLPFVTCRFFMWNFKIISRLFWQLFSLKWHLTKKDWIHCKSECKSERKSEFEDICFSRPLTALCLIGQDLAPIIFSSYAWNLKSALKAMRSRRFS